MRKPTSIMNLFSTVLIIFLVGCTVNTKDAIVGKWQLVNVYRNGQEWGEAPDDGARILEFFSDGTVTIAVGNVDKFDIEMTKSKYTIEGENLTFDGVVGIVLGENQKIILDGNKLMLTYLAFTLEFERVE